MYERKFSPSGYELAGLPAYRKLKCWIDGYPWFVIKVQRTYHFEEPNHTSLYYKLDQLTPQEDGTIKRETIFEGDDIGVPGHKNRMSELIREAVFRVSMRPGDTDADFFEDYTPRQLQFCAEHAEALSIFAEDPAERRRELKTEREWQKKHGAERAAYEEAVRRGEY